MAIFDVNGNELQGRVYGIGGNLLTTAYDVNGTAIVSDPVVIRVLEYNVGNFAEGGTSGYTGSDLEGYMSDWVDFIQSCNANICLFTESRRHVDNANTVTAESMYDRIYDNVLCYNFSESYGAALLTDSPQSNMRSTLFSNQARSESKYVGALININGVPIYVCSIHFVHGGTDNLSVRIAQMNEILTAVSNYENVIIGGDLNTFTLDELATLENAGFTFANGGASGTFNTYDYSNPTYPLDNVGVKGHHLSVKSFALINSALSDHIPTLTEINVI